VHGLKTNRFTCAYSARSENKPLHLRLQCTVWKQIALLAPTVHVPKTNRFTCAYSARSENKTIQNQIQQVSAGKQIFWQIYL